MSDMNVLSILVRDSHRTELVRLGYQAELPWSIFQSRGTTPLRYTISLWLINVPPVKLKLLNKLQP